tara:strand:- start:396 stop:1082 length:687 start_codon:yes stop_codon:yes gene_type:complete
MNKISVLIAGETNSAIKNKVGLKKKWYSDALSSQSLSISFYDIYNNDDFPLSEDNNPWIITGSEHSVYDNLEWLNNLKYKLSEAINKGRPVLGVCFGHQLLADVIGGTVAKNKLGWEVGYAPIELTSEGNDSLLFNNFPNSFYAAQTHQDIVQDLPEECTILAKNNMGIQSFSYKDQIFGVQFHPEFNQEILDNYINLRADCNIDIIYPNKKSINISSLIFKNFMNKF